MKGRFLIVSLLLYSTITGQSEKLDSLLTEYAKDRGYDTLIYSSCKNEKWAKNKKTKTFEHQGKMHSYYIGLNNDFTFVFEAYYEPGIDLTVGKWHFVDDSTISLTWNKKACFYILKNKNIYSQYTKWSPSVVCKILNWTFTLKNNKLLPVRN